MTATVEDLIGLPGWPALLSAEQAAKYCGMSEHCFRDMVSKGLLPKPARLPIRRRLWYRAAIDDTLGSKGASSDGRHDWWGKRHKDRSSGTR